MLYISFDFSVAKPACTIIDHDGQIHIYCFPYKISKATVTKLQEAGVHVCPQQFLCDKPSDSTDLMVYNYRKSTMLADLIINSIKKHFDPERMNETYLSNEGFSFASVGASNLDLAGYKYILLQRLDEVLGIPLTNSYTYPPITVKSFAGCAKKGMGKLEVIESSKQITNIPHLFYKILREDDTRLKSKINYIDCVDDIVDSLYVMGCMLGELHKIKNLNEFFNSPK